MNQEINRIHWKCRRGMREIDLLLREFAKGELLVMEKEGIDIFDNILDYDDQKLFDITLKERLFKNNPIEFLIINNLKNLKPLETFN